MPVTIAKGRLPRRAALAWLLALAVRPATAIAQERDRDRLRAVDRELLDAAERGDVAAISAALARGAAVDVRDARGRTPAMAATHARQPAAVAALFSAGANVNLRDDRLDNPFLYAGAEGLLDILRLAIAAGADPRITNRFGGTALIPAAERGHVEVVRELLTRTKVDVNHVNNLGWTALLEAIVLSDGGPRHQRIVELLLAHGADVNIADRGGVTPLAHARSRGFTAIAAMLVKAGAR
ncbi:MAG: ankyrin repeat domain-containing protein [Betaproteobacteria bacterium]|nr:ankyrin repeat domain-containing protein [Betaproteobacteria bacterium]